MREVGNYQTIQFQQLRPAELPERDWTELHDLALEYWDDQLSERSAAAVRHFVSPDVEQFRATRLDPQSLVGDRHNAGQSYRRPTLIIGRDQAYGDRIVGETYWTDNVSGSQTEQFIKRLQRVKYYRACREIVVAPGYRERSLDVMLAGYGLRSARGSQTGVLYTFPEEAPDTNVLTASRAVASEPATSTNKPFGAGESPVQQQRFVVSAAHKVGQQLLRSTLSPM